MARSRKAKKQKKTLAGKKAMAPRQLGEVDEMRRPKASHYLKARRWHDGA
jgi:hypothetical protein